MFCLGGFDTGTWYKVLRYVYGIPHDKITSFHPEPRVPAGTRLKGHCSQMPQAEVAYLSEAIGKLVALVLDAASGSHGMRCDQTPFHPLVNSLQRITAHGNAT